MKINTQIALTALAGILVSTSCWGYTLLTCYSDNYVVNCSGDDVCSPPPPTPSNLLGTVNIIDNKAAYNDALTLGNDKVGFKAEVNTFQKDGADAYTMSLSLTVNDGAQVIQNNQNGDSVEYVNKSAPNNGNYSEGHLTVSCKLQ